MTSSPPRRQPTRPRLGCDLTDERRTRVRAVADAIMEAQEAALAGREFDESVVSGLSERDAMADPFAILGRLIDIPEQAALALSAVEQASGLSGDEMFYLRTYMRASLKSARAPMLLRAVFVTCIGIVEPLVTRLVLLLLYYASPGAYESLADPALEFRARELSFGAPGKWRESLVVNLGITTLAETVDWERLAVLREDRNVIVHRGSVSDSRHGRQTEQMFCI